MCFQIQMSHKVLSSDMGNLVQAMKLAQEYSSTLLDGEYRKGMLQAAHVLAVDAKQLLDTVEGARKLLIQQQQQYQYSMDNSTNANVPPTASASALASGDKSHTRNLSSSSQTGFLNSGTPSLQPQHSQDNNNS